MTRTSVFDDLQAAYQQWVFRAIEPRMPMFDCLRSDPVGKIWYEGRSPAMTQTELQLIPERPEIGDCESSPKGFAAWVRKRLSPPMHSPNAMWPLGRTVVRE